MTKQEHMALIEQMKVDGISSDEVLTLTNVLVQDYDSTLTVIEELSEKLTQAETERDRYAKLNNELWLEKKVSDKAGEEDVIETEPAKLTFESLESKF